MRQLFLAELPRFYFLGKSTPIHEVALHLHGRTIFSQFRFAGPWPPMWFGRLLIWGFLGAVALAHFAAGAV